MKFWHRTLGVVLRYLYTGEVIRWDSWILIMGSLTKTKFTKDIRTKVNTKRRTEKARSKLDEGSVLV